MTDSVTLPVPLEPLKEDVEDRRLWVGNLDPRVNEKKKNTFTHQATMITDTNINLFFRYWFTLVKLLQTYGSLQKFDLLFHRSGPLEGQPRGYAFVTYTTKDAAETAKSQMDGMLVGCKNVSVKWAHSIPKSDLDKQKIVPDILSLGGSKLQTKQNRVSTIKAIEAKLKIMQNASEASDFEITDKPTISQNTSVTIIQPKITKSRHTIRNKSKPYFKTKWKI